MTTSLGFSAPHSCLRDLKEQQKVVKLNVRTFNKFAELNMRKEKGETIEALHRHKWHCDIFSCAIVNGDKRHFSLLNEIKENF